jgi:proline iminopeptidase
MALVDVLDTRLNVISRGEGHPLICLHGGPGLDHHEFGDYLDPLTDRYRLVLVDQRSQGLSEVAPPETWTIAQMARDVAALARALELDRYAVLGHSFGAFVALQHAVDFAGEPVGTIVSSGVPSMRYLAVVEANLAAFEPVELREQVAASWAREATAQTQADCASLMDDQLPFHFRDPRDPRIAGFAAASADTIYAPDVLRAFSTEGYGGIELEDRLGDVTHPVLVLAGRHDRVCSLEASEATAAGIASSELAVLDNSAHMTFVEEPERYLAVTRRFLDRLPWSID